MKEKINIKIWIIIVIEIMILGTLILNTLNDNVTDIIQKDLYKTEKIETSKIDEGEELGKEETITNVITNKDLNGKNPLNTMFNIGNKCGYLLTYPDEKPVDGEKITIDSYASDQLLIPVLTGYPKVSYEELGLNDEEEAYQATQLAIWEISNRTGESDFYSEKTVIAGIREEWGNDKGINTKIFDVAEEMVKRAETEAYIEVPTLTVTTKSADINTYEPGYYVFGPYYYTLKNLSYFDVSIKIEDEEGNEIQNSEVVDKYGNTITSPIDIEEFYIKVPKKEDRLTFIVTGKGNRPVGRICIGNDNLYIYGTTIENKMTQDIEITVY